MVEITAVSQISPSYLAFFPLNGFVASGVPRDYSANGISLYPMASLDDSAYWAAQGRLTIGAGANLGLVAEKTDLPLSVSNTSNILLAFEMTKATPGASQPIMGWTDGTVPGIAMYAETTGKLRLDVWDAAAGHTWNFSNAIVADGTPHTVVVFINNIQSRAEIYIDGCLDFIRSYVTTGSTLPTSQSLGLGCVNGINQTTFACVFRGLHFLRLTGVPINGQEIAQRLSANIMRPLSGAEFRGDLV